MDHQLSQDHTDLRDYFRPIWQRRWLILVVMVVVTAGTYWHYSSQPKLYQTKTDLFFGSSETDQLLAIASGYGDRNIQNQATLMKAPAIAAEAARTLKYKGDPRVLASGIQAKPTEGTDFITITAVAGNPLDAANLANAFAKAYVTVQTNELRGGARRALTVARRELDGLEGLEGQEVTRSELITRIRRLESVEALPGSSVRQVDTAPIPGVAFQPNPTRNTLFALVLSLMLGIGLAMLLERLDRRIRRLEDVQPAFSQPLLTDLPHAAKAAPIVDGTVSLPNPLRESFRSLRTNLQLASLDRDVRTVLVTSAVSREGKSTIVSNLALAYREAGLKVCAIDADLRRAGLAEIYGLDRHQGLTNVLTGGCTLEEALQEVNVHVPGLETLVKLRTKVSSNGAGATNEDPGKLSVLTSGPEPANPPAVLAAERMQETLRTLADEYDIVLIDSPPLLAVSDTVPLLSAVDGVILVARVGMTTTVAARSVTTILSRIPDANVLGVVANDIEDGALEGRFYGQHAYGPYGYAANH